ncbi:MAG: hypothetical protein IJ093_00900 [Bacilli bacterium]|nr:hypothetical protein [Bacilli bacterium]
MESIIYKSQLEDIIVKIGMYINEEEVDFDKLKNVFINLSYCYKTNNTNSLTSLSNDINNSLKAIDKNCKNDTVILKKVIEKYVKAEQDSERILSNIKTK